MEHIIILPSDASFAKYPDNKIGSYKIDLDPPIDLSQGDKWEVALLDISYPTRWNNVLDKQEMKLSVRLPGRNMSSLEIPVGSYVDPRKFVLAMQNVLKRMQHMLK